LPPGVYFRDNVRVRQVHGLKFVDQQDPDDIEFLACCSLHRSWYIFESLSVLVHVVVMLLAPMLVVCLLAALMNHQWALVTAPYSGTDHVNPPLLWADLVQPTAQGVDGATYSYYPLAEIFLWESGTYGMATLLRMVLAYTELPSPIVRAIIMHAYAAIFVVHIAFMFTLACMIAAWFLVSSVLNPTTYLPYAVVILVTFVVCREVGTVMLAAAAKLAAGIRKGVKRVLRSKLRQAKAQMTMMAQERLLKESNKWDDELESTSLGEYELGKAERDKQEITAADIFALLKEARDAELEELGKEPVEDDEIDRSAFRRLFGALDLDLSDGQLDRLFAVMDLSGSNTISVGEFEGAWDLLQTEIVEEHVKKLGVSGGQICVMVMIFALLLVVLLTFILLIVSAWVGEDNFGAVIKSSLIAFVGQSVTKIRTRSKAEVGDGDLDDLVENVMAEQEEQANED